MSLLLADVEVRGTRCDVLVHNGRVGVVGGSLPRSAGTTINGDGGALIPGLHDHHLHLLSMAAERGSVPCGPPTTRDATRLADVLRSASACLPPGEWIRGTGYHEQVAGLLDAHVLDEIVPDRPVRVQHRSGALWMLNTAALRAVTPALDGSPDVERDVDGRPNGRLWRYDARLRTALPAGVPDLSAVGRSLAAYGITGVTDATPRLDASALELLREAGLPQRLLLLGAPLDAGPRPDAGPWKIHLPDHALPALDSLVAEIEGARRVGRAVAVHCVTQASLLLTLTAIEQAGAAVGDRIEHAAVVPPEARDWMRRLRVTVVTQPGFVAARGDDYLRDVDTPDLPHLYAYRSLLDAGVPTAASSDAPYGPVDPWAVMLAAQQRATRSGAVVAPEERVPTATALAAYLAPLERPGGPAREVRPGADADLVLMRGSLRECLATPDAGRVRLVLRAGEVIYGTD